MPTRPPQRQRRVPENQSAPWDLPPVPDESTAWHHDLVDYSHDLFCVHDLRGRLLNVNPIPARLLGYTVDELLRIPMHDLVAPQFRAQFDLYLKEIALTGSSTGLLAVQTRSGEQRIWEYRNTLHHRRPGEPVVWGIAHDVTERAAAEKALRANHARLLEFERVVENLEDMVIVVDRDYRYTIANRAFLAYWGRAREQVVGQNVADLVNATNPGRFENDIKPKLDECLGGKIVRYTLRNQYPGKGTRDVSITYLPVEGPAGIDRVACVLRDVTEANDARARLEESETRGRTRAAELETILETLPIPVLIAHDRECQKISANRAALEHLKLEPGANASLSAPAGQRPTYQCLVDGVAVPPDCLPLQRVAATGIPMNQVMTTVTFPDQSKKFELANVTPIFDESGEIKGAVAAAIDITDRIVAAEELQASEERLRLAQEVAHIGMFERNFFTGESRWTPEMEAMYGLEPGSYPKTVDDFVKLVHPDDRSRVRDLMSRSMETGEGHGEWRVRWPDGSLHWLAGRWRVFKGPNGNPARAIGMDFDITERKKIEEALRDAKRKLTEEKLYLEHEINAALGFNEIIGKSQALQAVIEKVGKVAGNDATVLLLGETGTGKELVARAIHRLSQRSTRSFIKTNCAAIPTGLLESELFGNEKGAFTGAISRKIGRVELADNGTLFLDEIGELSLALQPKLLRVLQDQEFERLGGTQTLKVNFRLIAATNRDLQHSVHNNEFRSDLFYRLNVFPIRVPPLRERRDDIPLLVEHFAQKFAQRMKKKITCIPAPAMSALQAWEWPGNIRELENFVERSVILTHGTVLVVPLSELREIAGKNEVTDERLETAEREHILRALRKTRGQVGGPSGAAALLGLKRTTLQSKIKLLGIDPRSSQN